MRLFGFPIRIRISFVVVSALIGALSVREPALILAWVLVVGVSILIHELGHAFAGRAFGRESRIELHGMGGVCVYDPQGPTWGTRQRILVALAGPFAGFLFGGLIYLLAMNTSVFASSVNAQVVFVFLLWVNLGWGLINLLPMLPLDGGMVMHAVIRHIKGDEGARRPTLIASMVVAGLATGAALYYGFTFAAMLAIWLGFSSFEQLRAVTQFDSEAPLRDTFFAALDALESGERARALELAQEVLDQARSPTLLAEAAQIVAGVHAVEGRHEEALEVLERLPPSHSPPAFLEAQLLLRTGRAEDAVSRARVAHGKQPGPGTARVLAEALAETDRRRELRGVLDDHADDLDQDTWERLQAITYRRGTFEMSAELGAASFDRWATPRTAFNTACAQAEAGHPEAAREWLERAVERGWYEGDAIRTDPGLEGLRDAHPDAVHDLAERADALRS